MNTKDRFRRAALRLFVAKGITETTVRDIGAAVGVTDAALYRHFSSKEELAWDIFVDDLLAMAREFEGFRRAHKTSKPAIEAMVRRFCAAFDEDQDLITYLFLAWHSQHEKVTADMPTPMKVVIATIADGMKRGDVPKRNPVLVASMVYGICRQAAVSCLLGTLEKPLGQYADALVAESARMLRGR